MAKWHKIKKAQARKKAGGGGSPRNMKRMMKKLQQQGQMDFEEIEGVEEVIIKTSEKEIVISAPQVTRLEVPGQGEVFQVVGKGVDRSKTETEVKSIEEVAEEGEIKISPEDAQLVAQQAGVSLEEGMAALKQTNGDLAKAILLIKQTNF